MNTTLYNKWENDVLKSSVIKDLLNNENLTINDISINMSGGIKNVHGKHFIKNIE
ncbi:hypothetical protein [Paraliobacillus ryukyuensis]|uniref:hypothetical protein n=1 Tax=Paraliobacillus ryukyuensis TaxID=200904 RepID=UPI0015C474A2|nr:hypothetical protein [Paraliobacillus ryukyuensis]